LVHGTERASSSTKIASNPTSSAFFAAATIASGEASKPR
jgi:hypothetical protein